MRQRQIRMSEVIKKEKKYFEDAVKTLNTKYLMT